MRDFKICPKPQNRNAQYLFVSVLIAGAVAFGVSFVFDSRRGLLQLLAVCFLVTAVFVYTKYIGVSYVYEMTEDADGTPVFVICQRTGKRISTLCRVSLCDVTAIEKLTGDERRERKVRQGFVRYVYTPTLFPDTVYLMTSAGRYESSEIVLEGTDEFADMLRRAVAEAKERIAED